MDFNIYPLGDFAIIIEFQSSKIHTDQESVQRAYQILSSHRSEYELVPAYRTLTVHIETSHISEENPLVNIIADVTNLLKLNPPLTISNEKCVHIPVCYESPFSPDLSVVANYHDLTELEVIEIHTHVVYQVSFIGFAPGFPFLRGLSKSIHTPRKASPRISVAQGSVGVAGNQTGIYPCESPGGWQIIGRTPVQLFAISKQDPSLLSPGDWVKFYPITKQQYHEWELIK